MKKEKPLYGIISHAGGNWSVMYKVSGDCTYRCTSGYGDFPHERFPRLPVIDFRNSEIKDVMRSIALPMAKMPKEAYPDGKVTLKAYLAEIESFGITVIRPSDNTPKK